MNRERRRHSRDKERKVVEAKEPVAEDEEDSFSIGWAIVQEERRGLDKRARSTSNEGRDRSREKKEEER